MAGRPRLKQIPRPQARRRSTTLPRPHLRAITCARSRPPPRHTGFMRALRRSTAMSRSKMPWMPSLAKEEADLWCFQTHLPGCIATRSCRLRLAMVCRRSVHFAGSRKATECDDGPGVWTATALGHGARTVVHRPGHQHLHRHLAHQRELGEREVQLARVVDQRWRARGPMSDLATRSNRICSFDLPHGRMPVLSLDLVITAAIVPT